MSSLTVKQIQQYQDEGYVSLIDVLSKDEAKIAPKISQPIHKEDK